VCWKKERKERERKRGESEKRLSRSKSASWSLAVPDGPASWHYQVRYYLDANKSVTGDVHHVGSMLQRQVYSILRILFTLC